MLAIISPSKTLDFEKPFELPAGSDPEMVTQSKKLVTALRKKSPAALAELMDISQNLAELNALRYSEWKYPFPEGKARPALAAFKGDVYEGLKAWELGEEQLEFSAGHLRIISGLYGLLKPLDRIMAYRIEMGTSLPVGKAGNLYQFWGDRITRSVKKAIKESGSNVLVNLASAEYAKAIDFKALKTRVITPVFKEFKDGSYRFISFHAKRARGLMTRYIIDHSLNDPESLKVFNYENYEYMDELSKGDQWVFVR